MNKKSVATCMYLEVIEYLKECHGLEEAEAIRVADMIAIKATNRIYKDGAK